MGGGIPARLLFFPHRITKLRHKFLGVIGLMGTDVVDIEGGAVGNQMQRGCFADQHAPKHPFHLIGGNRHANRGGIALREGLKDSSRNSGTGVVFCGETKYNKPAHKRVFHIKESYKRDFLYAYERRTIYNSKHSIHFVW